jgi:predicted nucleic acid-binding protein
MILVDTTPLVALVDRRDRLATRALRDLGRLRARPLVVLEAVLVEAAFHLARPAQRARLRDFLDVFAVEASLGFDEARMRADVFDWLAKYADQDPDWADAALSVASGYERKAKVWTYDQEFRTTWRRLDGSKIPLVAA